MKNNEEGQSGQIDRPPAVAGLFYPADSMALRASLKDAFSKAEPRQSSGTVLAIISPHAGYTYSAKVAASAFNQIDTAKTYEHIFVIGSSHKVQFDGASIYTLGDYITPLGHIQPDPLGKELIRNNSIFTNDTSPHQGEHTIEVQLPFLQYLIKQLPHIVPIILGTQSAATCNQIAKALQPYFNEKNLFVISTDFTHYPDYETAKKLDAMMADAVLSNSPPKLIDAVNNIRDRHTPNLLTGMCGWTSVLTLMDISSTLPGITIKKIDYQNSGDIRLGDKSRVVGYVAIAFEKEDTAPTSSNFVLKAEEKQALLALTRNSIVSYLRNKQMPRTDPKNMSPALKSHCGVFVSLHLKGDLRGCIGTFRSDVALCQNVKEIAIAAATKDYRFTPLSLGELDLLEIEISVLTPLRKISSIEEITLGKHGIYIKKNGQTGTLLPQVATERNWTREEFLGYCSRDKAGLGWDGWKDADIYVYEAIIFSDRDSIYKPSSNRCRGE